MDLGIKGRNALVCAASKGLGRGCAMALVREGVNVTITARTQSDLEAMAQAIRHEAPDVTVTAVAGDITTPEGRAAALAACPQPDILVNNAGGPPPGDFRDWSREDWIRALEANMLTPIELIKATVDGMMERGFGRIVNITSSAVKAPIDILGLSNGARSGLTGFVAGLARKTVRRGVTNCHIAEKRVQSSRRPKFAARLWTRLANPLAKLVFHTKLYTPTFNLHPVCPYPCGSRSVVHLSPRSAFGAEHHQD
jgi:3-oxoacyl-[acyl-carrier protein] reductase